MENAIGKAFNTLLNSFNQDSNNISIELALIDFCNKHGYEVDVGHNFVDPKSKVSNNRHFTIGFRTSQEAIQFASHTGRTVYGFTAILVEVAPSASK